MPGTTNDSNGTLKSVNSNEESKPKATGKRKPSMKSENLDVPSEQVFGRSFIYNRSTSDFSITDRAGMKKAQEQDEKIFAGNEDDDADHQVGEVERHIEDADERRQKQQHPASQQRSSWRKRLNPFKRGTATAQHA